MTLPPTQILMLSANPTGTGPLRLDEERREIEAGLLERSRLREQFRLVTKVAVRPRDVQRAMLDHAPQVVHFSGHGHGEAGLALEDESGNVKLVSAAALAAFFQLHADRLQCVVLNACYSEVQAKAIAQHVPYVIGMNDQIGDRAAIEFAVAFYDALGAGRDVAFAYKNACVAIQMAGIPEAHIPILHSPSITAPPSIQNLTIQNLKSEIQNSSFSTYNPATFTGRNSETTELTTLLSNGCRVVAIIGMTGIGKTALAERVVASLTDEAPSLPYYRFSLDIGSLTPDFSNSGAALLRTLGEEPTLPDQQDPTHLLAHLLDRLCRHPCRLQIDSLERLLRGNDQEGWSEFCDPLWLDWLLQFLAGGECPSQLLLTSQDIPADLDTEASRYPQFWHCQTLQGLTAAEQEDLFLKLGLPQDGSSLERLRYIGAFYDGHPLVLQVMAEEIRQPPFQGKVDRYWQHYEAEFSTAPAAPTNQLARSRLFRRRVRQRVEQTLQRLPDSARQMLCACAVFRRPVPVAFWMAMLTDDPQSAFDTLCDRSLVEFGQDDTIRQHNLIRSVAYDQLKADRTIWYAAERQAAQLWLTHYESVSDAPYLETVRDCLEAFEHYCAIGDWETACSVLDIQIASPTQEPLHWQLETWGYYQEEISLYKKVIGTTSPERDILWYRGLGIAYHGLGNYSLAIQYHQQSLQLAQSHGDKNSEAKALGNLGAAYSNLGQCERAIDFYQQHLTIAREIGNRQSEGFALGNLGVAYDSLGQYERAIDFYQQHLTIAREIGDRQGEGAALGRLGNTYDSLGQYERAIDFHQQSLTIAREIGDRQSEGIALGGLGNTYNSLGQYERAIDFHQQYLTIAREMGSRQSEGIALGDLGSVYKNLGQYERAKDFYQQYLTIAREMGYRQGEGTALGNLGTAYKNLGQYERAIDFYQQRLMIAREIGDRRGESTALVNIGATQLKLEQYPECLTNNQAALELFREIGLRAGEAAALKNLAEVHHALGAIEVARQYCQQALALATELGIPLVAECEALQLKMQN
jgi:tetratricopeptide (TPR) repeat protein